MNKYVYLFFFSLLLLYIAKSANEKNDEKNEVVINLNNALVHINRHLKELNNKIFCLCYINKEILLSGKLPIKKDGNSKLTNICDNQKTLDCLFPENCFYECKNSSILFKKAIYKYMKDKQEEEKCFKTIFSDKRRNSQNMLDLIAGSETTHAIQQAGNGIQEAGNAIQTLATEGNSPDKLLQTLQNTIISFKNAPYKYYFLITIMIATGIICIYKITPNKTFSIASAFLLIIFYIYCIIDSNRVIAFITAFFDSLREYIIQKKSESSYWRFFISWQFLLAVKIASIFFYLSLYPNMSIKYSLANCFAELQKILEKHNVNPQNLQSLMHPFVKYLNKNTTQNNKTPSLLMDCKEFFTTIQTHPKDSSIESLNNKLIETNLGNTLINSNTVSLFEFTTTCRCWSNIPTESFFQNIIAILEKDLFPIKYIIIIKPLISANIINVIFSLLLVCSSIILNKTPSLRTTALISIIIKSVIGYFSFKSSNENRRILIVLPIAYFIIDMLNLFITNYQAEENNKADINQNQKKIDHEKSFIKNFKNKFNHNYKRSEEEQKAAQDPGTILMGTFISLKYTIPNGFPNVITIPWNTAGDFYQNYKLLEEICKAENLHTQLQEESFSMSQEKKLQNKLENDLNNIRIEFENITIWKAYHTNEDLKGKLISEEEEKEDKIKIDKGESESESESEKKEKIRLFKYFSIYQKMSCIEYFLRNNSHQNAEKEEFKKNMEIFYHNKKLNPKTLYQYDEYVMKCFENYQKGETYHDIVSCKKLKQWRKNKFLNIMPKSSYVLDSNSEESFYSIHNQSEEFFDCLAENNNEKMILEENPMNN